MLFFNGNIDLRNFRTRLNELKRINPGMCSVELFLLPRDYVLQEGLPKEGKTILSTATAQELGKLLSRHNIRFFQAHYPWQLRPADALGDYFRQTVQFCAQAAETADIEHTTINHHIATKALQGSAVFREPGFRRRLITAAETEALFAKTIIRDERADVELLLENNNVVGERTPNGLTVNMIDTVAEDFAERAGIDGICLDWGHAWTTVEYFRQQEQAENMEAVRKIYGGAPSSCRTMTAFFKKLSPRIRWLHVNDEVHALKHLGLVPGSGRVDWNEFFSCVGTLKRDVPATLEIAESYKPGNVGMVKKGLEFLSGAEKTG